METRARRAVCERATALPKDVWQLIISFLAPSEAVRAALVCLDFAAIAAPAAQQACRRLWPHHAQRLVHTGVQRFLRLVQAHEDEVSAHPEVAKAKSVQKTVCPEHRQIAVEWLIEVSWDWQLESTVVYRGTQYLDHYLANHAVPALGKFQMLAISCLRTALKHSSKLAERERQRLPYKHWSEVTDGACTEAEVRSTCAKLDRMLHQQQRSHPNAKQRLRYLWYRLYDAGTVKQEHVYVYMLASFLLHLSLLDTTLSTVIPTKLAAAALSMALKVFGFPPMPAVLEQHCFYLEEELYEVQQQLERAQEEVVGQQLRALWVQSYSYVGTNPTQQPSYTHLQQIVSACGKLTYLPSLEGNASNRIEDSKVASAASAAVAEDAAAPATSSAAGAAMAAPAQEVAIAPAGPVLNRVMTRSAAAAGLASNQSAKRQHVAAAPQVAEPSSHSARAAAGSSHVGSSRLSSLHPAQHDPTDVEHGIVLATPQRPTAAQAGPLAAVAAVPAAAAAGPSMAVTPPTMAGTPAGLTSSGQPQAAQSAGGSSARRCATRELPPRRAVAVSRYGMLASRGGNGLGAGNSAAVDAPGSSRAAAPGITSADTSTTLVRSAVAAGPAAAASSAAGLLPGAAGPSMCTAKPAAAAGPSAPPPGSMTPASPKHAAAGTRGLAALFAGVGPGGGGSSHNSVGSSTSRLLSGLPSLQTKFNMGDAADLQQRLTGGDGFEPTWLWSIQPGETATYGSHGGDADKAGPSSSSGASLHMQSVPVLRSTRRATAAAAAAAAAAAGAGSSGMQGTDMLHKGFEQAGVHTRSSSGGGSGDGISTQWHTMPAGASIAGHTN